MLDEHALTFAYDIIIKFACKGVLVSNTSTNKTPQEFLYASLKEFARQLTDKFSARASGEPEDQLKAPVEQLFSAYGRIVSGKIVLKGESLLHDRLGRPDYAAHVSSLPIGYIELKAPGKGANPEHFRGHDKEQWARFKNVPNLIYTDGNEWALYQGGELSGKRLRFHGDVSTDGESAVNEQDARGLFELLSEFTSWQPIVPKRPKELAAFLAPFCRLIREDVLDSLKDQSSPMHSLKTEIQALLFPDASEAQFADAYAETVMFALLLAQMEGANVMDLNNAYDTLEHHHALLARSLQFLTDKAARKEIGASLSMAQRVIHEIQPDALKSTGSADDPWLFFYEHFLAAYDPRLRKQSGVYFTPLEVVNCQVHLVEEVLIKSMGKKAGFVEAGVATLDPATGTGTYLLAIVDHALKGVNAKGRARDYASALVKNLHGFEWMVGPYAVAQLRLTQVLTQHGVQMHDAPGIYLTNTLESPHTKPPAPPLFHKPIAQEHERALKVKESERILVCLGNPPYRRHEAKKVSQLASGDSELKALTQSIENMSTTGGWVRYGNIDTGDDTINPDRRAILEDFLEPARKAGLGGHLKNIYNLYVYFIRWSLWKVFEHSTATGPGILSFITASSYLDGDAFVGLREHMRRLCDCIDIIDLGGEGRGTRQDENVFAIQTPVAIFIAWRKEKKHDKDKPARVRYTRIEGTRKEKLATLEAIKSDVDLNWELAPDGWQAPFRPASTQMYFKWPEIVDLFPWQQSGVQVKRTWPIAHDREVLRKRWNQLVNSKDKAVLFKETRDRNIASRYPDIQRHDAMLTPLDKSTEGDYIDPIQYCYRSFDRQWVLPDNRLCDYLRPVLWHAHSERQVYLSSCFQRPLDFGPALTCASSLPDLNHFCNRGAKDTIPLYRDADCKNPNVLPDLLDLLSRAYSRTVMPEDFAGYVYALLAQPEYTSRFADELASKEVRVPLTKDVDMFVAVSEYGKWLIWLHTYGERMVQDDRPHGEVPQGRADYVEPISEDATKYPNEYSYNESTKTIHVGDGKFAPVSMEVWQFEVSGFKVVQSWLGYRMKQRKGKKSSPLDEVSPSTWKPEFSEEFLKLLWILEHTIVGYPKQKQFLDDILSGDLYSADELPPVPDETRTPPAVKRNKGGSQEALGLNV